MFPEGLHLLSGPKYFDEPVRGRFAIAEFHGRCIKPCFNGSLAREFIYQYNGKSNLRDAPELVLDDKLPVAGEVICRRSCSFRVQAVTQINVAQTPIPRFLINLVPLHGAP
jgi:hypothetical protein